jgi:tetratricopeptide (TPR) repeat protein
MHISLSRLIALCLLTGWCGSLRADDQVDCKPILEKAVKAMGGQDKLDQFKLGSWNGKVALPFGPLEIVGLLEGNWQGTDHFRLEGKFSGKEEGLKQAANSVTIKINGKRFRLEGAGADNGLTLEDVDPWELKMLMGAVTLPPLLAKMLGKDVKLSPLGELKINNREAVGIRVNHEQSKDVSVFFDKENGLPIKTEIMLLLSEGEEVSVIFSYSDYKDWNGLNHPAKIAVQVNKGQFTLEINDLKAEERLEAQVFDIPKDLTTSNVMEESTTDSRLESVNCHLLIGDSFRLQGKYKLALEEYETAIKADPKLAQAHAGKAWILATCPDDKFRDGKKAVESAKKACELSEWKNAPCFDALAAGYAETGEFDQAIRWEKRALNSLGSNEAYKKNRKNVLTLYESHKPYRDLKENEGLTLCVSSPLLNTEWYSYRPELESLFTEEDSESNGGYDKALEACDNAIKVNRTDQTAYNKRAWIFATCPEAKYRDGKKAVDSAKKACEFSEWKDPNCLDTLAAAYAEAGDFVEALKWQKKAMENPEFRKNFSEEGVGRLKLYQDHKAYRDVEKFR